MGVVDAVYWMISGGVVPGGRLRTVVCTMAVACASAVWMFACGWKKILMTPTPFTDCDSMCSMLLTVMVMPRSELVMMRSAISSGANPAKFQTTLMTGILMSGKMSTGVRTMTRGISRMMTRAITTNV